MAVLHLVWWGQRISEKARRKIRGPCSQELFNPCRDPGEKAGEKQEEKLLLNETDVSRKGFQPLITVVGLHDCMVLYQILTSFQQLDGKYLRVFISCPSSCVSYLSVSQSVRPKISTSELPKQELRHSIRYCAVEVETFYCSSSWKHLRPFQGAAKISRCWFFLSCTIRVTKKRIFYRRVLGVVRFGYIVEVLSCLPIICW